MGTHPHEWFMFHGAQFGYKHANYLAMTAWQDVYDGDLGIALTDTYGSDNFFANFSKKLAKLFDGIRQDSGDELVFADKAVARYVEHGIDPLTKTIIFSNALNFHKAAMIADYCKGKIKYAFGIGTNLTNDIDGTERSNIVMKLTECKMNDNATPMECIKLSDDKGKHLGSDVEVATAKYVLGIKD
jgi:nicotinate phosphoribosyltransferase